MEYVISTDEFERFRKLIYDESGITLSDQKRTLLVSRLSRRLRDLGLSTFSEYYDRVTEDATRDEFTRMLDLISTNKTDFFRESNHFDFLRDRILPELEDVKRIRIWSSACSTGEEPYTIAITLYEGVQDPAQWEFKILASDLSTRVLAKAATGIYETDRVKNIPEDVVRRHFLRGRGDRAGFVKVKPHLAAIIRFRRLNLMDDHYPIKNPLDLIFCRNVMIYFDRPTQYALLRRFRPLLRADGLLFAGHSENFLHAADLFRSLGRTTYAPVPQGTAVPPRDGAGGAR